MRAPQRFLTHLAMFVVLSAAGSLLWQQHARAWDLGRRSPVLSYDSSQYAVAARELAIHGRFATLFALPLELARHPAAPWPLALVQPGLVICEAALIALTPARTRVIEGRAREILRPDQLEWTVLVTPYVSFMLIAIGLGLGTSHILRRYHPQVSPVRRAIAGTVVGLAFLLDPEAQHFAVGGFTELPFTLGLVGASAALALGIGVRVPLLFGLALGVAGAFRGTMLWLAPAFAIGNTLSADPGERRRVLVRTLIGYVIPLTPWWLYKWHAFGTPAWDLSALSVWDGVQGRTWFSLFHTPDVPDLPHGGAAASLLAQKLFRNLPGVLLSLAIGVRPLLMGGLALWLGLAREAPRALRLAAGTLFVLMGVNILATAISVPQLRYLFPVRVIMDAAGVLALWGLIARSSAPSPAMRRTLPVLLAATVLVWGVTATRLGDEEAHQASMERGTPSTLSLLQIAALMSREIPAGEPVMSNLGPALSWESHRPVIHLVVSPDQITACRRRADFRNVLLVFRDAGTAWPEWTSVVAHPVDALHRVEWNVRTVRRYDTADGFMVIWLVLGPLGPELAGDGAATESAPLVQ